MADRAMVMEALEVCSSSGLWCPSADCPYSRHALMCKYVLMRDALDLLNAQTPRVLTLEEIRSGTVEVVWLEDADKPNVIPGIWFRLSNEGGDEAVDIHIRDGFVGARLAVYGKMWRAWTSRPTEEQRKAVPWDAEP